MTGTILIPSTVSGLVLPTSAMLSDAGEQFVFLHWKDQFWVRRNVHVLATYTDKVVVDGINPGDMIATQGAFLLKSDVLREKMGAGCAD